MSMERNEHNAGRDERRGGKLNGRWVPICAECLKWSYKTPGYCCARAVRAATLKGEK